MSVTDPMNNGYPILKIIRPDGKVLSRYNYWMQENNIYFVDYNPSYRYNVVYRVPLIIGNVITSNITTESARITWITDRPSDSLVKYGTKPGIYTIQKRNATNDTSHSIKLFGLSPNTTYYYVVNGTHQSGNSNQSFEYSFTTSDLEDTTPPMSIDNLLNITYASTYINFTWLNPLDSDFNHTILYLNGAFLVNVTASHDYYNITGLTPDTLYELSTRTADTSGNINETWSTLQPALLLYLIPPRLPPLMG